MVGYTFGEEGNDSEQETHEFESRYRNESV